MCVPTDHVNMSINIEDITWLNEWFELIVFGRKIQQVLLHRASPNGSIDPSQWRLANTDTGKYSFNYIVILRYR